MYSAAKRMLDVVVSAIGLLVVSPVMLLVSLIVLVTMGRPILYRQRRAGLGGRTIEVHKFRTMRMASGAWDPSTDASRLTVTGRFLRRWSLDELPQLWDVLRGAMSLVGPRPLPLEYLPRYSPEQARRHEVVPGITGWAQVHGRNSVSWPERFALDVWYVDHRSFLLDMRILMATLQVVLHGSGVTGRGEATMTEFKSE